MSNIMDGLELSKKIEEELKQSIKGCIIRPSVAVIEVGDNEDNEFFVKAKEDACNRIGIYFRHYKFDDNTPELTIINKIKELNNDDYVNGISIQLPLPEKYNEKRLINTIINSKDIDGVTDINVGRLINGRKTIISSKILAIIELLKEYNIELESKDIVIIGNSRIIGKTLVNTLLNEGATVTVCHSKTYDLKKYTKGADIIISTPGNTEAITEDMVNEDAVIIDVGFNVENGKIISDIDFDKVSKKVSLITPTMNGIADVSIAMFLKNTLFCYNNKK